MIDLPELTDEERAALDNVDMNPILGTAEERLRFALDKAVCFMRERNTARAGEKMAWAEHAKARKEIRRLRNIMIVAASAPGKHWLRVQWALGEAIALGGEHLDWLLSLDQSRPGGEEE